MMSLQFGQVASWLVIESEQREGDESGSLTIISWNETIEAHRREVRGAILDATAALVNKHGLLSVTMSRIAQEAGIGRATPRSTPAPPPSRPRSRDRSATPSRR